MELAVAVLRWISTHQIKKEIRKYAVALDWNSILNLRNKQFKPARTQWNTFEKARPQPWWIRTGSASPHCYCSPVPPAQFLKKQIVLRSASYAILAHCSCPWAVLAKPYQLLRSFRRLLLSYTQAPSTIEPTLSHSDSVQWEVRCRGGATLAANSSAYHFA